VRPRPKRTWARHGAATGSQAPNQPWPDLSTRVGSVALPSPVLTASGTSGHGAELASWMDLSRLGAVVVKSLSAEPWEGNPPPRLWPLADRVGLINSVGLQNKGVEDWLSGDLPALAATGARVVASVWGFSPAEFARVARSLARAVRQGRPGAERLVAVELNISCPNVEDRRSVFAHSPTGVAQAVGAAVEGLEGVLPAWAKLSPNVTDLVALARVALDSGAEALTLVNTLMGLAVDPRSGRPRLGGGGGGISGPALHPVAVRAVWECRQELPDAPIVGVGGVTTGEEAAELLVAGADALQVGTASFAEPGACARVAAELASFCHELGVKDLGELRARRR